jgi:hypothetical protein
VIRTLEQANAEAPDPLAMERLKSLLSERATQYETAHYTVDTSDCDVAEVVERTLAIVRGA